MSPSLRRAARVAAIVMAASILAACAGLAHTPDHVTTIVDRQTAAKPSPLRNVAVVTIVAHFGLAGRSDEAALRANGDARMDTLMPAIAARLPVRLARDGIRAEAVKFVPGHPDVNARGLARFDYVIEFKPTSVSLQKNTGEPSLMLNVRLLNHMLQLIWVARVELRTDALPDGRRADIREWREAMADDLAGLLLQQLGQDGFVPVPAI